MEEYLQYMKTLRSQMNDVEEQAAKISVDEQTLFTTIQTMEIDLTSAKCETERLKQDIELMIKAKGQICAQILEKQRNIASLEVDSSTLARMLELIKQEKVSVSAKLFEKSAYYGKVADELNSQFQKQKDWFNSQIMGKNTEDHGLENHERKNLVAKLDSANAKLDEVVRMKSELVTGNNKMKESIEKEKLRGKDYKPELLAMYINALEEEHKALLSDKAGESDYLQSLQVQLEKLKGISHVIKCACGEEYNVGVGTQLVT